MHNNIEKLISLVEEKATLFEMMLGFKLNYTPQSLKKLEQEMVSMFGNRGIQPETAIFLGVYVGQVLVKHIKGAEWRDFKDNPFEATVVVTGKDGSSLEARPISRVNNFSLDHTDGIYAFYCMLQDISKGRLGSPEQLANSPITEGKSPRGYEYKVTAVDPELVKLYKAGDITEEEMLERAKKQQG